MRLLICAGGTGGGVYPALTVLKELNKSLEPEVLWVGGEGGMEADLVTRAGITFEKIPAAGVHGVSMWTLPGNLVKLGKGTMAARKILKSYKPDALFFTGGYVAIPVGLAARLFMSQRTRPRTLLLIPDIEPGQALKTLASFADHIVVTTDETKKFLPAGKQVTSTGYPVRQELKGWDRERALAYFNLQKDMPILLVVGGSTGARSINRAVMDALPRLLRDVQVIHVSGQRDWDEISQRSESIQAKFRNRYRSYPYLHEEMGAAMAVADLVLSRAGASALGEYPYFGLPAILVPYPYAWRYQRTNAQYLVRRGAAVILDDARLGEHLVPEVLSLIFDRKRLDEMKQAMRSVAKPDAASEIAGILHRLSNPVESSRI